MKDGIVLEITTESMYEVKLISIHVKRPFIVMLQQKLASQQWCGPYSVRRFPFGSDYEDDREKYLEGTPLDSISKILNIGALIRDAKTTTPIKQG